MISLTASGFAGAAGFTPSVWAMVAIDRLLLHRIKSCYARKWLIHHCVLLRCEEELVYVPEK
jgi:hypothetical protein